jgi:hypothetical protein|tara:strand:+ start:285 stop:728 length:444 start_codon:yes stop_codon:yes gene_type:complete
MTANHLKQLQAETGLSRDNLIETLGLSNSDKKSTSLALAELDAIIETYVLNEIDLFLARSLNETILIRFISENDFALYEPEIFNDLKHCSLQKVLITRSKRAIERIGGEVAIAFMDGQYYETWLGVNDFDDNPDLRIAWASQQIKGA